MPKLTTGIEINNSPNYPRLNNRRQAYIGLIKNWNEKTLDSVKEIKTLALNDKNDVICEITIPAVQGNSVLKNVLQSLRVAKEKKAVRILFGENQPFKHVNPDFEEKQLAATLREASREMNLPIKDQLIVSEKSFYSYAENGLI